MSIYRRKSGKYAVLVDLDPGATGLRRRRSLGTFVTKKEAEKAERDALQQRDRGIDLAPRSTTVADVVTKFLAFAETRLEPTTTFRYREIWEMHLEPTLGRMPAAKLRASHLSDIYTGLAATLSPRTILHVHRMIHRVLAWAERLGLVDRNVARLVEPPKAGPSPARALTDEEAAHVLTATEGTRWHPFFVVALTTGMRRAEIFALTWPAIDLEKGTLSVRAAIGDDRKGGTFVKSTKTGHERTVPLPPDTIASLRKLRAQQAADKLKHGTLYRKDEWVFCNELGEELPLDSGTKAFMDVARGCGIAGASLHSLRHTAATWMLSNGVDVLTVASILGHRSPNMTLSVYGHVVEGRSKQAVDGIQATLRNAQAQRAAAENRPSWRPRSGVAKGC